MTFISHTSHLLQYLDVEIFGPFKKYFKVWKGKLGQTQFTQKGDKNDNEKNITRVKICLAPINSLHQAFEYSHVNRGFCLSGIWSRDRDQTLKND